MNSEHLLNNFDRFVEAPDAIPRLRRFILDLAVRGKLLEQDLSDEPAIELLQRIKQEKIRLVREGVIKDSNQLSPITEAEIPFNLPSCWTWTRLGDSINNHLGGGTPSKNNPRFWNGDIFWASVKDIGKEKYVDKTIDRITEEGLKSSSSNLINRSTIIVVTRMGLGKVSINRVPIAINQDLRALFLTSLSSIDFYYIFFKTASYQGSGLTVKGIKVNELMNFPFPLPPLAEQHRIVAKVDELMTLCGKLEAAQTKQERRRDRLVAATLHGINNGETSQEPGPHPSFKESARFYFNHFPRLTIRPEHIQQLRQAILNLAVRGKLVPQDPNDESVSQLIADVQNKLEHQIIDLLPSVDETSVSFTLPPGWAWERFSSLGIFGRGRSKHRPRNDPSLFEGGTHRFIQTGDVARSNGVITSFASRYNEMGLEQSKKWPKGTLCITIAANIADSGILEFDACFPDSVVGFIPASPFPNARYFEYFIRTVKSRLLDFAPATAQKNINLGILNELLIPLPPLAELKRIVEKVDELMSICDELEAGLEAKSKTQGQFLEATLLEALH